MKNTFTQSMAWLHTWGGLIFGWLLFAIFVTGTLAVFDKELNHGMQPEIPASQVPQAVAAQRAIAYLQAHEPQAGNWGVSLPTERSPGLRVSTGERRHGGGVQLDPRTGEAVAVRDSVGGNFFFRFHFTLDLPRNWGIFVVGALALVMLAALVTGIVIHKKIFKEFFTFRPDKGQRSWLDFHNASAVLLLPFHLMITYTGLVIFMLIYIPAGVDALFEGDNRAYFQAQGNTRLEQPRGLSKQPAELVDVAPLLAQAEARLGPIAGFNIRNPNTAGARIEIRPELGNRIALSKGQAMVFDGVSGQLLSDVSEWRAAPLTQRVMVGLHFAQFGGYPMRWLYFVCGVISCVMIASGLVLFCVKRGRKYAAAESPGHRGYRLAEVCNVGFVAGLLLACVGLLWASRLLPMDLTQREAWEVRAFFAVWLLALLHASLRPARRAWVEQLAMTALLCIGLVGLGTLDDALRQGVAMCSLVLGFLLGLVAWRVWRAVPVAGKVRAGRSAQVDAR
ncbi:PepSY-associated TM helix domain-containing protein [Pseudomonas plecoglossicida]|uniref:PepSY domain-containing protein n=1 Tax=Pseudomonas plecoglossicida TaxID=70775 RepID=A0AAD0QVS2_PSEDL|nr:PepSY-associated TM helix domain-containing protein [Pseudomonas plecoglossicida]AXM95511.1 PepSY domain-containing protein [Pseudomonas plecoglossicida]EPB94313.1 PepSY-associated TM helix domain-containing protein [Pseudomonas plecoglossicida NB2011]QLB56260.1 PepSY domain-containing protein [Pseudomonas plecoglossicida]GLR37866.1 membrane protein [Pseudomonas plecoglossicida]